MDWVLLSRSVLPRALSNRKGWGITLLKGQVSTRHKPLCVTLVMWLPLKHEPDSKLRIVVTVYIVTYRYVDCQIITTVC